MIKYTNEEALNIKPKTNGSINSFVETKFLVFRKVFWIFSIPFCECEEVIFLPDDQIIICKTDSQVIAIIDKKLFRYAKRI